VWFRGSSCWITTNFSYLEEVRIIEIASSEIFILPHVCREFSCVCGKLRLTSIVPLSHGGVSWPNINAAPAFNLSFALLYSIRGNNRATL
jgi:hypothetical protein